MFNNTSLTALLYVTPDSSDVISMGIKNRFGSWKIRFVFLDKTIRLFEKFSKNMENVSA